MDSSFTAMSVDALNATLDRLPDDGYPMVLNRSDMAHLLCALQKSHDWGTLTESQLEWVQQFMSTVSATVGVEHV